MAGRIRAWGNVGGGNGDFWRFAPNVAKKPILKVSAFGDSITAGDFNRAGMSRIWPPEYAADIIANSGDRTTEAGSNLWPSSGWALSSTTESGGVFSLGPGENPRFADSASPVGIPVSPGKLFVMSAEIDTTNCIGEPLSLRWFGRDSGGVVINDKNFGGDNTDTGGYISVSGVISADYMISLAPSVTLLKTGGEINGTSAGNGEVKNVDIRELSKGVAVVNQGVSGNTTTSGLARISEITGWSPDVVVVAFGTNDIRNVHDLALFKSNLEQMCSIISTAGGYPVLASIPALASDQPFYSDVPLWNSEIRSLAMRVGAGFWDRWSVLGGSTIYIEDGRHPNTEGYKLLGASLASEILSGYVS